VGRGDAGFWAGHVDSGIQGFASKGLMSKDRRSEGRNLRYV